MKENEYKDLKDGIENLMNTFGGYSKNVSDKDDASDVGDVEIEKVIKAAEESDKKPAPEGVNVDELLNADAEVTEESLEVAVDELEASVMNIDDGEAEGVNVEELLEPEAEEETKEPEEPKKDKPQSAKNKTDKKKSSSEKNNKNSDKNKKPDKKKNSDKKKTSSKNQASTSKKIEEQKIPEPEEKVVSPAKLIITLAAICAAVALLLGAVNLYTKSQIEENNRKATLESIREIFDSTVQVEQIEVPNGKDLNTAYLVMKNGGICGYSATVSPSGFGGPIELMVGISSDGKVVGVDVVSMSETPGLGSKTGNSDFLSQFIGAAGEVKVDAISGATISSKAVAEGVNAVITDLIDITAIAVERGMSIVPFSAETDVTTAATKAETETAEAVVPTPPETTEPSSADTSPSAPDVSKGDTPPDVIVPNPNNGNGGINADYASDTTEFETLTTEPESTEPGTDEESETEE